MNSQYKIFITPHVTEKVDLYTLAIRSYYIALYTDTGLWEAEEIIKSQYIEWADALNHSILNSIREIFHQNIVPYSELKSWQREASFRMGNRRIFLTYEEDTENMTRYITDIEILRK